MNVTVFCSKLMLMLTLYIYLEVMERIDFKIPFPEQLPDSLKIL